MTPKPMVFTGPMVLAIMADLKTQSRRIINPKIYEPFDPAKNVEAMKHFAPHQPGDIVYVGEHLFNQDCFVAYKCDGLEFTVPETHKAKVWPWKKSLLSNIFMPRWAARTYLLIKDVKAERIQNISNKDIKAEGMTGKAYITVDPGREPSLELLTWMRAVEFQALWNSIHGPDAWDRNDWGWAYKLKRVEKPEED